MTCAKKQVKCVIQTLDGHVFEGMNDCLKPQKRCPRGPGEDYTKCKTICDQPGHAEEIAIEAANEAGADLTGATAFLSGIDNFCKSCQRKLYKIGVRRLEFVNDKRSQRNS